MWTQMAEDERRKDGIKVFRKPTSDYTFEDFRQSVVGMCMEKGGRQYVAAQG